MVFSALAQRVQPRAALAGAALAVSLAVSLADALGAQAPAELGGTAYDSLHARPLVGATVRLEGSARSAVTDGEGRFRIDSIPPGTYSVRLMHPLLDTLGLQIATKPAVFAPGVGVAVDLAVPSQQTILAVSCPPARRLLGPGALIGRVLDAESDTPLPGARVSIAWTEVSPLDGFRKVPRVREAVAGEDGSYRICGLPAKLDGTVQGMKGSARTAEIHITLDDQTLAFRMLRIGEARTVVVASAADTTSARGGAPASAPAGASSSPAVSRSAPVAAAETRTVARGAARLSGKVINANGAPVANARVDVAGTDAHALTRENGEFALDSLPSGTQSLVVRQLGFAPVETAVELSARAPQRVTVTISKPARVLETVAVKADREEQLDKVGFASRKRTGLGYYLSPDQIADRQAQRVSDLFRSIPGLQVVPSGNGIDYEVRDSRNPYNGCVVFYVDGAKWQAIYPGDVDRILPTQEIGAIEVYSAADVPAQFQAAGQTSCSTVVMWSKTRLRRR